MGSQVKERGIAIAPISKDDPMQPGGGQEEIRFGED
jgi:hypothetical protein